MLALVAGFAGVPSAAAQGTVNSKAPGVWTSSINIQNTGSGAATVSIGFYDSNGNSALTFDATPDIPVGGQRTYYVSGAIASLPVGQYAAVVSSNEAVQVVANASSTGPLTYGAYAGVEAGQVSDTLNFPGLYKNYYNFYSQVVLQNVEATAASNVMLYFYGQKTGLLVATVGPVSIPANASRVFAMQDLGTVPSGNTNGLLSLRVTSDRDLAGIANVWSSTGFGQFSDYNAFTGGTTTIYVPALYKNYYSFVSALTVQNLSSTDSANIEVTYSNGVTATATLLANQAIEYYQPNNAALPSGNTNGVFSARVVSTNAVPIVALVTVDDRKTLASYNGAGAASTNGVNCAMVNKAYFGGFTAQTVQNVGNQVTDITITYSNGGAPRVFNGVQPNGTINIIELPTAGTTLADSTSAAAVITSSNGQPLVTVVQGNRVTPQNGDTLLAYTCAPK
jgi:hypothetical protein